MSLGETLRLRRETLGLSQVTLAKQLGVTQQTVSRWESGDSVPRPHRIAQLADALLVSGERLLRLGGYTPTDDATDQATTSDNLLRHLRDLPDLDLVRVIEAAWDELLVRTGFRPKKQP